MISGISFAGSGNVSEAGGNMTARLQQAVSVLNQADILGANRELTFSVDTPTGRPVVRVIDRESHQVVAQLPSEYVLRLAVAVRSGYTQR